MKMTLKSSNQLPLPQNKRYVPIPRDIIVHKDSRVLAAYIYLCVRRGEDDQCHVYIKEMVRWFGLVPNSSKGRINESMIDAVHEIVNMGYAEILGEEKLYDLVSFCYLSMNPFRIEDQKPKQRYAYIHFDEISKIVGFFRNSTSSSSTSSSGKHTSKSSGKSAVQVFTALKVFTYLKMQLKAERDLETNSYSESYASIAKNININKNSVTKIVSLLECIGDYGSDKCLLDSKIPMFYVQHPVIEVEDNGVRYTKKLSTRFYLCYDRRIGSGNKVTETVYKSPSL